MHNYDERASAQIKISSKNKGVIQKNLVLELGISATAMSRIFNAQRQRLSISEFIHLHQALGNCPIQQLAQLINTPTA